MDRHIDKRKKTENLDIDPHKYAQWIFDKVAKATQRRKDRLFNK